MTFAVGSLVKCRGRDWVVLPDSDDETLLLRPLGGTEDEVTGIHLPLEPVQPATFELPDPTDVGDHVSCRLLRDAVRLGFRASAGPFRSFGHIACEPRPYQLVPLMMALRLDPIRMLIADDVGIGKTIEALLIARELIDRGEVTGMAVLCPPHLAEQWQAEMRAKFHIDAELILSGTVGRLERGLPHGTSVFEVYPYTIVSTDYIKSSRRRDEFLRTCPSLVIVDEAHTCASAQASRGGRHHRHELLKGLSKDANRHVILVTATPHSGIEASFRSLLGLLEESFINLPEDLSGEDNRKHRERLARHLVQRRRADIRTYLDADTPFPDREEKEATYKLSPEYRELFQKVLKYVRERVRDDSTGVPQYRQRVRWWAALALLRTLASSPAAAATALRTKAAGLGTEDTSDVDELGRQAVMDTDADEDLDITDTVPGADAAEDESPGASERRRLRGLANDADALAGKKDNKLARLIDMVKDLLREGFTPIVFCRFIATAEYVATQLRGELKKAEIEWVTGQLPPEEREQRVADLGNRKREAKQVVLVATDCLSEGINLQEHFDAVIHYDLAWSPTRHEQRDGRVDRFGQPTNIVRSVTLYGLDNRIDAVVLKVLLKKHQIIRNRLGISVPVPFSSNNLLEALIDELLLKHMDEQQLVFEQFLDSATENFHGEWENASEREKKSRTLFAQHTLQPTEVARELDAVRETVGTADTVARFLDTAVQRYGGAVIPQDMKTRYDLRHTPALVRDAVGTDGFTARFELPVDEGVVYLTRTHPIVESLAAHVMDTALDPVAEGVARRCGVTYTSAVKTRTTLLLLRLRYHIHTARRGQPDQHLLAEDCRIVGFRGAPDRAEWLDDDPKTIEDLLDARPDQNIDPARASDFVRKVIDGFGHVQPYLDQYARHRGEAILDAHKRVREATRTTGVRYAVEPQLPVDVLGIYVFLPV